MHILALSLLALTLSSTGCAHPEDTDEGSAAVQGGRVDPKDAAVGLVWFQGGGFCTGTLIAPDVVLTAGHCVEQPVEGFYLGPGVASGTVTATPPPGMERHGIVAQLAHPSFAGVYACPIGGFDVALLRLAKPVVSVRPRPLAKAAPSKGTTCAAVGYGTHNVDASHVVYEQKRRATEVVEAVTASAVGVVEGSGIVDRGDSGGPLLCGGAIAGVTSCKTDGDYPNHHSSWYGRVDGTVSWVESTLASWKKASADGGVCRHDACTTGDPIATGCDPCVAKVCSADPYCCQITWDASCVSEAKAACGLCRESQP